MITIYFPVKSSLIQSEIVVFKHQASIFADTWARGAPEGLKKVAVFQHKRLRWLEQGLSNVLISKSNSCGPLPHELWEYDVALSVTDFFIAWRYAERYGSDKTHASSGNCVKPLMARLRHPARCIFIMLVSVNRVRETLMLRRARHRIDLFHSIYFSTSCWRVVT